MASKNRGICHSCRQPRHTLECPKKRACPKCGEGFVKWMEVEKNTENMGKMFRCCTRDCRYFKWTNLLPAEEYQLHIEGESSGVPKPKDRFDDLSHMFKELTKVSNNEDDLEISFSITIRKGKRVLEGNDN